MAEPAIDQTANNEHVRQVPGDYHQSPFAQTLARLAEISHSDGRPLDVLDEFATVIKDALSVDFVLILEAIADRDVLLTQAAPGLDASAVGQVAAKRDLGSMSGYTLMRQTTEVLEDVSQPGRPYDISTLKRAAGAKSGVTLPITPTRALHGVLGVFAKQPRQYSNDEVDFLNYASHYLAGTILRHKETALRKNVQRWLRVLEEATIRSVSATNQQSTLQSFTKFLTSSREGITDVCFIDLESTDGQGIVREAAARNGTPLQVTQQESPLLYPPDPGCPYGTPAVLDSGQPHTITAIEQEHLECLARDEAHLEAFRSLNPVSFMCLPIKAHRHTLGALVLISCDQPFTREDERHAGRLAYIVGMAVEATNARMQRLQTTRQQVDNYFPSTAPELKKDPPPQLEPAVIPEPKAESTSTTLISSDKGVLPETQETTESLTNREVEILTLADQGLSLPKIISQLAISKWTCYSHFRNAKLKLNLPTDTPNEALVSVARDLGYIKR
jgi:GAF domain-containing protein/DNA-binding CsgD family transcriptional regulator